MREALLNALVHRDYSFSGSIIINVNDSCMEFISIGGLLPGYPLTISAVASPSRETGVLLKSSTA